MVAARALVILAVALLASGCGPGSTPSPDAGGGDLIVDSPQIVNGSIAAAQTCDGGDQAPEVHWSPLPTGGRGVLMEMLDPDAPGGTFTHWLAYSDADTGTTVGG